MHSNTAISGQPQDKNSDPKLAALEACMKRQSFHPESLIEILHDAQGIYGWLDESVMLAIAHRMKLPPSRVYGVATFYSLFLTKPPTQHTCNVCLGTACYVKGGYGLMAAAVRTAGPAAGGLTKKGSISLKAERCIGACAQAPAIVIDGKVCGNATSEFVEQRLKDLLADGR